jgi:hypothetical protein
MANKLPEVPPRESLRSPWVDADRAWVYLGLKSYKVLYGQIQSGLLRLGDELRDRRNPGAQRPVYQVHIDRADARLETPAEQRTVV